jgi:serine/threonine protein kinase
MPQPVQLPEKFGRYQITKMLGAGGMGVVYLAKDSKQGDLVALKVPRLDSEDDPQAIDRFLREAKVALGIQHPNLCHVREVDAINGIHFLTMPYIRGTPLSKHIAPDKHWPPEKALVFVAKLASAMQVVHQRGIMHRDLKPQNVMVQEDGEPVIMDFGLARGFGSEATRLTATGAALGTPVYMSPEQIKGQKDIGPRTDIYSLGVILYELLTGKPPFSGNAATVLTHILYKPPKPPSERLPALGTKYDALLLRALAKEPEQRYASMAEFAGAIAQFLPGSKQIKVPQSAEYPATPRVVVAPQGAPSGARAQAPPRNSASGQYQGVPPSPRPSGHLSGQVPSAGGGTHPKSRPEMGGVPPATPTPRSSGYIPADPRRSSGKMTAPPAQQPAPPPEPQWKQEGQKKSLAPLFWLLGGGAVAVMILLFVILLRFAGR